MKCVIEIDGLTDSQRRALEDLMAVWETLGAIGSSRWTAFYADGDGNFRPKITVDGKKPKPYTLTDPKKRWLQLWQDGKTGMNPVDIYMMDFDEIAWERHGRRTT